MKYLFLFCITFFIAIPLRSQEALPEIDYVKYLNKDNGLADRIIHKVGRTEEGLYFFQSDKLQFFTGSEFVDPIIDIPDLTCATKKMMLSEEHSFYDFNGEKFHYHSFHTDSIIHTYAINEDFYFVVREGNACALYNLVNDAWKKQGSINRSDLKTLVKLENRLYGITDSNELISEGKAIYNGEVLYPLNNSNSTILLPHAGMLYFSFEGKRGTFRLNELGKVDTVDTHLIIHDFVMDEVGNALMMLRNERFVVDKLLLVDSNKKLNDWSSLLEYSDILTHVYSEDFTKHLVFSSMNGVIIIHFVKKKEFLDTYLSVESKDQRGFGKLIIDLDLDASGQLLAGSEIGPLYQGLTEKDTRTENYHLDELTKIIHYDTQRNKYWIVTKSSSAESQLFLMDAKLSKPEYLFTTQTIDAAFQKGTTLYCGGINSRVYTINERNELEKFSFSQSMNNEGIRSLFIGAKKLIGSNKGLYEIIGPLGDQLAKSVLPETINRRVLFIDQIEQGYLIGTYGSGIYILDEDLNVLNHVNEKCCSINNYIYSIEQDANGNFWVGTNEGLFVLDSTFKVKDKYTRTEGVSDAEFNTQASTQSADGKIYFGSLNGVTIVDPQYYSSEPVGEYFIKDVKAYKDDDIFVGQKDQLTHQFNFSPDSVVITLDNCGIENNYFKYAVKNDLQIDSDLDYSLSEELLTIYKTGYKDLDLHINGLGSDPLRLSFTRNKGYLARLLSTFVLSILFLGYLLYSFLEKRSKRKLKEANMQRQIAQSKLEALRSQLNPHFIFNSLGAISYFIQAKESRSANSYLTKFAKLIRGFLESSRNEFVTVLEEIKLITYYLELEKMRHGDAFDYIIDCHENVTKNHDTLPSMLIQPFVENALLHGISHRKDDDGIIKISFEKFDSVLMCCIDDNGVGRKTSADIKAASIRKHKSRATEIISDRVKFAELSDEINLTIDVKDKYDGEKSTGTRVIIKVENLLVDA